MQGKYNETDLTYEYCLELFQKLEAAKRESFSKETMRIWFMEFIRRGWTKKIISVRYLALLSKPIFGKENLDFADWVNAVQVFAEDEINILVKRNVDSIIARGKFLKDKKVGLTEEDKIAVEAAIAMEESFKYSTSKLDLIDNYKEELRNKRNWKNGNNG